MGDKRKLKPAAVIPISVISDQESEKLLIAKKHKLVCIPNVSYSGQKLILDYHDLFVP
jgi:hypothetical protein